MALILAVLMLSFILWPKAARAHDHYNSWREPTNPNASCCNERKEDGTGDCEIAPYELRGGNWYVYIRQTKKWEVVPTNTILRKVNPDPSGIDGHVCWTPERGIICARPPTGAL